MLACSDVTTSYIAHTTILEVGKSRYKSNDVVGSLEFINGSVILAKNKPFKSWLTGTRTAVLSLRKSGVDITFTFEHYLLKIYINGTSMPTSVITYTERKSDVHCCVNTYSAKNILNNVMGRGPHSWLKQCASVKLQTSFGSKVGCLQTHDISIVVLN